jgi:ATP-binding protein involved in chromosome partitioning
MFNWLKKKTQAKDQPEPDANELSGVIEALRARPAAFKSI